MSTPHHPPTRVVVHAKDIRNITGVSARTARHIVLTIRKIFDKQPHQFVTVQEFCAYTGIDLNLVHQFLDD